MHGSRKRASHRCTEAHSSDARAQAEQFYYVHNERAFFGDLCDFMSSGPIVVQVLEGEDAIAKNREIMGRNKPRECR